MEIAMIKGYRGSLFDNSLYERFCDAFPDTQSFIDYYNNCGVEKTISQTSLTNLYALLMTRYGENHYSGSQEIFKLSVMTTIFQYGPAWEARLEIQKKIRDLTEEEIQSGDINVQNQAANPSTENTQNKPFDPLTYINNQNASTITRSKLAAYSLKYNQIVTDVTEEFLVKFKPLFRKIVANPPLYYITEEEDE